MNRRARAMTAAALAVLALGGAAGAADVPHLSGGVGADSREELAAREGEFNLKVTVAETSGDFLADVQIVIESARKEPMLDTTMQGPLLLAKLPPGTYTIRASHDEQTLTRTVTIPAQGRRSVVFHWPASR